MKKCKMCGSFLSNTATVCPKCGVECKEENEVNVEPVRAENNIAPINVDLPKEENKTENNRPIFCSSCGTRLSSDAKFCPRCGKSINVENINANNNQDVDSNAEYDSFRNEMSILINDHSKPSTTNLVISVISVFCCSVIAVFSLISSINSLKSLNNFSQTIKDTTEYRSIRNKQIIALVLSIISLVYFAISMTSALIELITNFDEIFKGYEY